MNFQQLRSVREAIRRNFNLGDTFYSLARTHYGDGKAWQKIASANPGVDPHKLRVGQTIVIP